MAGELTLLPCPFCGTDATLDEVFTVHGSGWRVRCTSINCGNQTQIFTRPELPPPLWNARADAAARVDVSKSVEDARALSKSLCDRGHIAMSRTIDELADNLAQVITKNTDQALRIFELEQQLANREAAK